MLPELTRNIRREIEWYKCLLELGHEILSEPPRGVAWLALTGGVLPC